jgi:hypothetical protein
LYEIKRDYQINLEQLEDQIKALKEDVAYYMKKCDKLEAENKTLKLEKDQNKELKKLENENDELKS